jgi:3-dehydroquinate synthase
METIHIITQSKNYPVFIGQGGLQKLSPFLKEHFKQISKLIIITDEQVANLHLSALKAELEKYDICTFITPVGESAKTFNIYYQALSFALEQKLDRNSILLAFGGGAIGDLGGFIAATYMRGIPFIQVPTTILAHDSAVGGKVAINHPIGKNMIGSFYQPDAVIYDLDFLETLSLDEKRSGFAELIKHALLDGFSFFNRLSEQIHTLKALNSLEFLPLLTEGIKVKARIIANDEKEQGERAFLNLGHTLGHAIEAEAGFGKITHGEAVVIGMIFALKISKNVLNLQFDLDGFNKWLIKLGYQTQIPKDLSRRALVERMKQDKKTIKNEIRMILLKDVGQPTIKTIPEDIILRELSDF